MTERIISMRTSSRRFSWLARRARALRTMDSRRPSSRGGAASGAGSGGGGGGVFFGFLGTVGIHYVKDGRGRGAGGNVPPCGTMWLALQTREIRGVAVDRRLSA